MNEWQPIETAPKDGRPIDVWCVPPDDCDFEPVNGGVRLTDVLWQSGDNRESRSGWIRMLDDGSRDYVEGPMENHLGLPAWKPTHWMPRPEPPESTPTLEVIHDDEKDPKNAYGYTDLDRTAGVNWNEPDE